MRDINHEKLTAEQQLARIERRERWENIWLPIICIVPFALIAAYLCIRYPMFAAIGTAIGFPIALWLSRK